MMYFLILSKPIFGQISSDRNYDLIYGFKFENPYKGDEQTKQNIVGYLSYMIGREQWIKEGGKIEPSQKRDGEVWIDQFGERKHYKSPDRLAYCFYQFVKHNMAYKVVSADVDPFEDTPFLENGFIVDEEQFWSKVDVQNVLSAGWVG